MPFLRAVRFWQATSGVLAVALVVSVALLVVQSRPEPAPELVRAGISLDDLEIVLPDHPLPAYTPLRIDVTNLGDLPHDLVIDDIAATEVLDAGASTTLELGGLTPGVYRLHCDVEGHVEAGMVAELVIADAKARDHEH